MENTEKELNELDYIDLRTYLKMLNRWKWLMVGITLLAVITSGILSFLVLPPVYESKAVIMVSQYQDPKAVKNNQQQDDLESVVDSLSRLPEMTIKTYVGQVKNEALLRDVIKTLKLDKTIYTPVSLGDMIEVNAVPETNLIEISVRNTDPKLAALLANTVSDKFIEFVASASEKKLVLSTDFLSKQLTEKEKELTTAIKKLNTQRNKTRNLAYLTQEAQNKNTNLASYQSQLLQADVDYQQALAGKAYAEQQITTTTKTVKINKLDANGKLIESEELNPAYISLSQELSQKSVELAELAGKKTSLKASIDSLQNELKAVQSELNLEQEAENRLQESITQIKQTRDVLSEKLTQVQIVKSVNFSQTSLQIVTPAFPQDRPVSPKKLLNMAIGMILGLIISVGLAFILELTQNTINKIEDIEQHLGISVLGTIPFYRPED